MGNPSKPSSVKVDELKTALETLKGIQDDMNNPPAGSFEQLGQTIETDLKQGDNGIQGNGPHVAGERYYDSVTYVNRGWGDVKNGVATLINLLQATIDKHSGNDHAVADSAHNTNTTTQPGAAATRG
jgi:hypothetical protein